MPPPLQSTFHYMVNNYVKTFQGSVVYFIFEDKKFYRLFFNLLSKILAKISQNSDSFIKNSTK